QRSNLDLFLVELELDILIHGIVSGAARCDGAGVAAPQARQFDHAPLFQLIEGRSCRNYIRMLVREFEQQLIQPRLCLLYAAERVAATAQTSTAEHGARGPCCRYGRVAMQLLGEFL